MPLRIGVVVPNSNYIPFLAQDISQALELGLAESPGVEYELYVEPGGYNADKNVLIGRVQDLIIKHRVDIVTAPLNAGVLEHLVPHFSGQQVPLIVNTLGEDVISASVQDPHLFVNSLNLWHTSWMSGYWGAEEYGLAAGSAAALHDGGYGITLSFALGMEARHGQVVHTAVTHLDSRTEDPTPALQAIADTAPDFLMAFYSGKEALSFLDSYHRLGLGDRIPVMGLPMTVDEQLLDQLGEPAVGMASLSSWRRDTQPCRRFAAAFAERTGHPIHEYALLAYETGHLVARAAETVGTDQPARSHLLEALDEVRFDGPRGVVGLGAGATVPTAYLRTVTRDADGRLYNRVIEELETPTLFAEQLILAGKNLPKQGWINPYLAA